MGIWCYMMHLIITDKEEFFYMATLQYVGARYVPKLFDDGQGGMEWQPNTYYEPLTIVTYNNSSYTSRGPVSANVGNPAENGEHWAETGNYNAYIATIQEELQQEISDRIDAVSQSKKRTIIVSGDSLGKGYSVDSPERKGWIYWLKQLCPNFTIIETPYIGNDLMGFTSGKGERPVNSFLSALKNVALPANTKAEDITDVLIMGGTNDFYNGIPSRIESEISAVCDYIRSTWPNAIFSLSVFASPIVCLGNNGSGISTGISQYYHTVTKHGGRYIEGMERLICDNQYYGADNGSVPDVHLTQDGYAFYSPYAVNAFLTGKADYFFSISSSSMSFPNSVTVDVPPIIVYNVYPDHYDIYFNSGNAPQQNWEISRYLPLLTPQLGVQFVDTGKAIRAVPKTHKSTPGVIYTHGLGVENNEIVGEIYIDAVRPNANSYSVNYRIYWYCNKAAECKIGGMGMAIYNC